jgi:GNAT superfamily N-acetyltransferase
VESARAAGPGDLERVAVLWRDGVAALEGERGGALLAATLVNSGHDDRLAAAARALADPEQLVVVGLIDNEIFGAGLAHLATIGDYLVAAVDGVFVDERARGIGVGEAILTAVVEWATGRGARGVDAPALPGNRTAKAFFEAHGFVARLLVMHHDLTPPPPR